MPALHIKSTGLGSRSQAARASFANVLKFGLLLCRFRFAVRRILPRQTAHSEAFVFEKTKKVQTKEIDFAIASRISVMHEADDAYDSFHPNLLYPVHD